MPGAASIVLALATLLLPLAGQAPASPVATSGSLSVVFWVADLDEAAAFWKKVLGAEPVYLLPQVGFGELRSPVAGVRLGLARGARPAGSGVVPTFAVADLDATQRSLKAVGVEPVGEVQEMPGLCRLLSIADPSGNEVQFVQSLRAPESPLAKVAFLSGCWRHAAGDRLQEEVWTPAHGDTMYGQNRSLRKGVQSFFELLRIERRGDELFYVAQPGGGPPTEFRWTAGTATSATFENPEHDFPRRVRYSLDADGTLRAVVDDGTDQGKRQSLAWKKV